VGDAEAPPCGSAIARVMTVLGGGGADGVAGAGDTGVVGVAADANADGVTRGAS
jgi:hypothetical protein